ncbi:MAG: hypothetical protein EOL90_01425 [Spartobacteria bacterium]|nr:hypothetical protein [Spartobacteria bacterium]
MRNGLRVWLIPLACAAAFAWAAEAAGQTLSVRALAEGLQEPSGAAVHPVTGDVYVSEQGSGRILVLKNGRPEPALAPGWTVSAELPRWAISDDMPMDKWMEPVLHRPGAISISTNGTLFVAEQVPNGRILEFRPDEQGRYAVARCVPVPWLDQEFMWRDLLVDPGDRLYVVGADEIGSEFMKFGSALMRETDGNWWVIDFGPFANFSTFAISERQDVMLLGDRVKGDLSWWEVDRHMMLGGSPAAAGRSELASLALFPDGSFILGLQDAPGKASLRRMEPFTGQQMTLTEELKSVGDIAMDRKNVRYVVTDPAAGRLLECKPSSEMRINETVMRQIVRSAEGMMGMPSEAPAFLNNFFDRLQDAAKEILPEDSTHAVEFNLSDIAGKMPIVAGRVRAAIEVEGAEADPIESVEFFLLFPSKVVMTESAVSPSLSFFSARRKSGAVEQTKPLFEGDVGVYRMSGTNVSKVASAPGGLHVPVVVCGLDQSDGGVYVNLSFLGAGIYGDYYLTLFQGPREQKAKLVVKSVGTESGMVSYDASFMEEATIEGMEGGAITKEEFSNLLVSGFGGAGGGANRSVGWLKLGQFPASMTIAFGDEADETKVTGAQADLKDIVEKKRVERSLEAASDADVPAEPAGAAAPAPAAEAAASEAP